MLDAEFSTDTWMGLVAGRHIMDQLDWSRFYETFPRQDTFSYTFNMQPWFDLNWLSDLGQYWIYDRLGPFALVCTTWSIAACIYTLVTLAVHWRTRSWLAGLLAAALVGIGGRNFLEPRAAILGLLCLAALWALICAIEGQSDRRRWWPIILLLPLLVFWSNAHGSFVFGYALVALYVLNWVLVQLCQTKRAGILTLILPLIFVVPLLASGSNLPLLDKSEFVRWLPIPFYVAYWAGIYYGKFDNAANGRQVLSIAALLIVAIVIAAVLGPFGLESFTHSGTQATSAISRSISEWHPAYSHVVDLYPPMWRFWAIFGLTGSSILLLWLAGRLANRSSMQRVPDRQAAHWSLFDIAAVFICLCMTLWTRRFAPLLYVVSAPILALLFMRLAQPLAPILRGYGMPTVKIAAALVAVVTGWLTWTTAQHDLIDAFKNQSATDLLERTRGNLSLDEALMFMRQNQLRVNVLTAYGDGASVSFNAPLARVFIDGRADQLYNLQHFRKYWALMDGRTPSRQMLRILDETHTDAALLRRAGAEALLSVLQSSPDWSLALLNPHYVLFLRRGSPALTQLTDMIREDKEWRQAQGGTITPYAQASRAMVLLTTSPPSAVQALALFKEAINRQPPLGRMFYPTITRLLMETAGTAAASEYLQSQVTRVTSDATLDPELRSILLAALTESSRQLQSAYGDSLILRSALPARGTGAR